MPCCTQTDHKRPGSNGQSQIKPKDPTPDFEYDSSRSFGKPNENGVSDPTSGTSSDQRLTKATRKGQKASEGKIHKSETKGSICF